MPLSTPKRALNNMLGRFGLSHAQPAPADGGSDCLILMDVSTSMSETMADGTAKLEAAKSASVAIAEERAKQHPNNRVAVVTYGDRAGVPVGWQGGQAMLAAVQRGVQPIRVDGCTNIGAGINQAATMLTSPDRPQMVFLLSDGYNNAGNDPVPIAHRLKDQKVYIATRGFGPAPHCVDEPQLQAIASIKEDGHPDYEFWEARSLGHIVEQARRVGRICLPSAS